MSYSVNKIDNTEEESKDENPINDETLLQLAGEINTINI